MHRPAAIRNVPCDGCTLCCQGDAVRLGAVDLRRQYKTEPHPLFPGERMLAHKPNGECVYLTERGCSIHEWAPSMCREADCRAVAAKFEFHQALALHRLGRLDIRVWDRGRELLQAGSGRDALGKHQKRSGIT